MVLDQSRSVRKETGARYKPQHGKKKHALGRTATLTKIGETAKRVVRGRGSSPKTRVLRTNVANLYDAKSKKYMKAKIEIVTGNPANRHFVRRNIMTKGTIIKTDKGDARITSSPGQDGVVNAVLI
ncbi:MAG: 30S ribosomal protein S8e [Nanoarchaeota archaeon]|nr:30S ribosomal protein S8e [Nanoarchaeota archaeon]